MQIEQTSAASEQGANELDVQLREKVKELTDQVEKNAQLQVLLAHKEIALPF